MLVKVILSLEVIAILLCIHIVYGKKIKINALSIITFLLVVLWLDIVNKYELSSIYTFITHGLFFLYCMLQYRKGICETIISMELSFVLVSIIQFLCIVIWGFLPYVNPYLRDVVTGLFVCSVVLLAFPHFKLDKLQQAICRRHWLMYIIISFITVVIISALIMLKVQGNVKIGIFIWGIPAIIIILILVLSWDRTILARKDMEQEISVMGEMQGNYDELLTTIRENQHEFDNHIMAIMSSHHTYKTYEQLVEAQKEYVDMLTFENKYNSILLIGNKTLGGYLYAKFQEIDSFGINIIYKVEAKVDKCEIPYYYLIEILGVLLDNAVDATKCLPNEKDIYFIIKKEKSTYKFVIKNKHSVVDYNEIARWFEKDVSSKGRKHGIGLYHVKKICNELNCTISCTNENFDDSNWIVFELCVKEKEDVM